MSMFTLTGQIVNVFLAPKGVSKKTGEEYGGDWKVQIIGDIPLKGGVTKKEMIDLKAEQGELLEPLIGETVSCPVGFFASGKNVGFYIPQGHKIEPVSKAVTETKIKAAG